MQDMATQTPSSTEPGGNWPTTTARVISVLGLAGWVLSIVLTVAHYFEDGGAVAALTMVVVCFYTILVPAARPNYQLRTDKEQIADVRATGFGFGLSLILVLVTLFAATLRDGYDASVIVPAAFLDSAIVVLATPIFMIPLVFRVWRKDPNCS